MAFVDCATKSGAQSLTQPGSLPDAQHPVAMSPREGPARWRSHSLRMAVRTPPEEIAGPCLLGWTKQSLRNDRDYARIEQGRERKRAPTPPLTGPSP